MWSGLTRVAAAAVLAILPSVLLPTSTPASASSPALLNPPLLSPAAQGDACPEPNDTFQQACYLGPSSEPLGYLSSPTDVDAYRIEVLDFNTDVHVEMPMMPAAYKAELTDWNGDIIASSTNVDGIEVIDTTVNIPGVYYIFVHSESGGYSATHPYQIFRALTYPGASIPNIIDYAEFRAGSSTLFSGDSEHAIFEESDGRYTVSMKFDGVPESPSRAWNTGLGTVLTDFTMTVDARVVNDVNGGFQIFFRKATDDNTDDNTYSILVDTRDGQALLNRKIDGDYTETGWVQSSAIHTGGGVNRVVIYCFEDQIRININGEEIFDVREGSIRGGRIGLGAVTWGDPAVVSFDNIIITTPTEG